MKCCNSTYKYLTEMELWLSLLCIDRQQQEFDSIENELEFNDALLEEREEGIRQIQRDVQDVHEVFKDLAVLVNEQVLRFLLNASLAARKVLRVLITNMFSFREACWKTLNRTLQQQRTMLQEEQRQFRKPRSSKRSNETNLSVV